MSFEVLNAASQLIAAIGVVAGLVFVGVQIRQNTRAVRAAAFHAVTDSFNAVNLAVGTNEQVARLAARGFSDLASLSEEERVQFGFLALAPFRVMETLFYQSRLGIVDENLWITEQRSLKALMSYPGIRAWWAQNTLSFTPDFRAFVEKAAPSPPAG